MIRYSALNETSWLQAPVLEASMLVGCGSVGDNKINKVGSWYFNTRRK